MNTYLFVVDLFQYTVVKKR